MALTRSAIAGPVMAASPGARVLAACMLALAPVAVYGPKGLVVLAILGGIGALVGPGVRARLRAAFAARALAPLLVLLAWALAAVWWSPDPVQAFGLWLSLSALVVVAWLLAAVAGGLGAKDRRLLGLAAIAAGVLFVVLLGSENLAGGLVLRALHRDVGKGVDDFSAFVNPANAATALMALPLAAMAARRAGRATGTALALLAAGAVALGPSTAATLAVTTSLLVLVVVAGGGRWVLAIIAVPAAVGQMLMPILVHRLADWAAFDHFLASGPVSRVHRWAIWQFVTERIGERPLIGWGLDSSRAIPGGHEFVFGAYGEVLPLHPHNGFLQVWLELGMVGAITVAALLAVAPFALARSAAGRWDQGVRAGTLAGYLVLGQLSFGLWQNWWIAAGAIALALALAATPVEAARESALRTST